MDDCDLLREYALQGCETAFAELVKRHSNLVFAAALRQTGNPHAAEEVAQRVFVLLAQKAHHVAKDRIATGWLYLTTCKVASEHRRAERRRVIREQEAAAMQSESQLQQQWEVIAPQLDAAMAGLGDYDRQAVLLRYFDNKSFHEIGRLLAISDDTAQKRVSRALEKLRVLLGRRGVCVSASVLAVCLTQSAAQAAPSAVAASLLANAVLVTKTAAPSTLTFKTLTLMTASQTKMLITAGLAALAATGVLVHQARQQTHLKQQQAQLTALIQQAETNRAHLSEQVETEQTPSPELQRADTEMTRLRGNLAQLRGLAVRQKQVAETAKRSALTDAAATEAEESERVYQTQLMARCGSVGHFGTAMRRYAYEHGGALPDNLRTLAALLDTDKTQATLKKSGLSLEGLELVYNKQGLQSGKPEFAIKERKPVQKPSGRYQMSYLVIGPDNFTFDIREFATPEEFDQWDRDYLTRENLNSLSTNMTWSAP